MGHIIDISKWNDSINWDVLAPQVDLVICRVQYGSNSIDQLYKQHVSNLEACGIPHAAYAYGCYVSVNDAIVEAKDFMARTNPNAKFLVLDVEDDTLASCGATNLANATQAFIDTCKAAGWKVGLYVAHHMYGSYGLQNVQADFLWIPRYGGPKPTYACDLWQYADGATGGWLEGIGQVDLNRLNGDKPLEWFTGESVQKEGIGIAYITGTNVNLRSGPGTEYSVLRKLNFPEEYIVCEESNGWLNLGGNQWVKNDPSFVRFERSGVGTVTITADVLNVRNGPGTNYSVVKKVYKGEEYQSWGYQNGWYNVGGNQWLSGEYVRFEK